VLLTCEDPWRIPFVWFLTHIRPDPLRIQVQAKTVDLTYSQRVGAAWVAYIQLYDYIKMGHETPANQLDKEARSNRADFAETLVLYQARAYLALIGTHRRRTYSHDLMYGLRQLYMLFGKPWNAATEGNEHAHQDMKLFFHNMASHNPKNPHSDCYAVLRMCVIKRQMLQTKAHLLPHSKYAAMRANRVVAENAVDTGKKRGQSSGPKGLKCYLSEESKRSKAAKRLQDEVVGVSLLECMQCCE
jgi:hypothetical protein